ncbi:copper chaperone PCu(A)C [Neptuniibacter sp. SY11_33]|uniref:copper chaperone PCu(A)C n=1 Tax=Neptuniibacter sp. SY11_33 TaxID=3398215 RepID=UPI0039F5FE72
MSKNTLLTTFMAAILSLTSFTAMAEITTNDAYVRAIPPGTKTTAAFVTISNKKSQDVHLKSASSNVADAVELHNHVMKDGTMMMRQVDSIKVAAQQSVSLKPGSYHIMLINLQQDLTVGENIEFELSFSDGTKLKIEAPVKKIMDGMHSHHHH